MLKRILLVLCALSLFALPGWGAEDPAAGRFLGTARFEDGTIQVAELDLIPLESGPTESKYVGYLKLTFGIPPSHEYVTFRFPDVRRSGPDTLIFNPWEQDLGLEEVVVDWQAQRISAVAYVPGKDGKFELKLSRDGKFRDEGFVRSTLEGVYQSTCEGEHPDKISIVTSRGFAEAPMSPNPFGVYQIYGSTARWSPDLYRNTKKYSTLYPFNGGVYDYVTGELTLLGSQFLSCTTDARGLRCDDCLFLSENGPPPHSADVPWEKLAKSGPLSSDASIAPTADLTQSRIFKGHLDHAALGISQKLEMSLNFRQDTKTKASTPSAVANLLFERVEQNPVKLTYRFQPKAFASFTSGVTFFQIPNSFAPADATLQITRFDGNTVEGNWYSWVFGYVGHFKATRNAEPLVPTYPKSMAALDALYDGGIYPVWLARYLVGIQSLPGRFFPRSENPFFPMTFGGYLMVNSGMTPGIHQRFTDGALDFYTGRFNLGNYFVGDADLGSARPTIKMVDLVRATPMGFIPRVDPSGSWNYSMPFRAFRKPGDYWTHYDGWLSR